MSDPTTPSPNSSDAVLFPMLLAGDPAGTDCFVRKHGVAIRAFLRKAQLQEGDVEEVYQEVFLTFFSKVGSLKLLHEGGLRGYLVHAADLLVKERRRKRKREQPVGSSSDESSLIESIPDEKPEPLDRLVEKEKLSPYLSMDEAVQKILEAIAQLPEEDQRYFQLRYLDQLEFHEIQEVLKLPNIQAASNRAYRARNRLKTILTQLGFGWDEEGLYVKQ